MKYVSREHARKRFNGGGLLRGEGGGGVDIFSLVRWRAVMISSVAYHDSSLCGPDVRATLTRNAKRTKTLPSFVLDELVIRPPQKQSALARSIAGHNK